MTETRTAQQCEALRRHLSMTQTEFAGIMGVSQAAVSQLESGARSAGARTSAFHDRLESAIELPTVTETINGWTTTLPVTAWVRVIAAADVGSIILPPRLDWSPRQAPTWDFADEIHRREIARIVIDVGNALDLAVFTDPVELVRWADELHVSRRAQPAFDHLIERLIEQLDPQPDPQPDLMSDTQPDPQPDPQPDTQSDHERAGPPIVAAQIAEADDA